MCPVRCRARRSRSRRAPAIPTGGSLLRVETPSAERIAPICPHFGVCGGCAVQHWNAARYRAWKRDLVVEALRQAGLDAPVADLIDAHGEGRRRAVFHAKRGAHDVLEVGFSAARAHQDHPDRPLPGAGQEPRRRAQSRLGDRGNADSRRQAARHPGHRDGCRARRRRARLGPADGCAHDGAGARRRNAGSRAAHPPRRTDRAAARADRADGHGDRAAAAGRVPAGDGRRRGRAGAARPCRLRRRKKRRRPVRRHRPVRAAACRTARGSSRSTTTKPRSARSSAPPRPPPASSRSRPSGATCSAGRW